LGASKNAALIPFSRRKPKIDAAAADAVYDEIEIDVDVDLESDPNDMTLTDEDFILIETSASKGQEQRRPSRASRPAMDPRAESSVADECLASIAAAVSQARISDPFIAIARTTQRSPVDDLLAAAPVGSLPPAITPRRSGSPFARSTSSPLPRGLPQVRLPLPEELPEDIRETIPVRRRTTARTPAPFARATTDDRVQASVAPVALTSLAPPPVVVHGRPRMFWVVAAAALGAAAAVTMMRLATSPSDAPVPVAAVAPSPKIESTPIPVAPPQPTTVFGAETPTSAPLATKPAPTTLVQFGEQDGVMIQVPAASAPIAPAAVPPPKPARASAPPPAVLSKAMVPDDAPVAKADAKPPKASQKPSSAPSFVTAPPPPPPPPAPAPSPAPKKPLTPEQQLAEMQLRAASR
jgi:hypothetical protein